MQKQVSNFKEAGFDEKDKSEIQNTPANAFLMALRELVKRSRPDKNGGNNLLRNSKSGLSDQAPSGLQNATLTTMKGQMYMRAKEVQDILQKVLEAVDTINPFKSSDFQAGPKVNEPPSSQNSESSLSSALTGQSAASSGQDATLRSEDKSLVQSVASSRQSSKQTLSLKFQTHLQRVGLLQIFPSTFSLFYSFYVLALLLGVLYVCLKSSVLSQSASSLQFADLIAVQTSIYSSFIQSLIALHLYNKETKIPGNTSPSIQPASILSSLANDRERYAVLKQTYLLTVRTENSKAWTTNTRYYKTDGSLVLGSMGTQVLDLLSQYKEYTSAEPAFYRPAPPLDKMALSYAQFLETIVKLSTEISADLSQQSTLQWVYSVCSLVLSGLCSAGLLGTLLYLQMQTRTLFNHTQQVFYRFTGETLKRETHRAAQCALVPLGHRIVRPQDSILRKKKRLAKQQAKQLVSPEPNTQDHVQREQQSPKLEAKRFGNNSEYSSLNQAQREESSPIKLPRDTMPNAKDKPATGDTNNLSERGALAGKTAGDTSSNSIRPTRRGKNDSNKSTPAIKFREQKVGSRTSTSFKLTILGVLGLGLMNFATIVDLAFGAIERRDLVRILNTKRRIAYVMQYGRADLISILARIAAFPEAVVKVNQNPDVIGLGRYSTLLNLYTDLSEALGVGFFQNPVCSGTSLKFGLLEKCKVVSQGFTGYTLQNAINGVDVVSKDVSQSLDSDKSRGFLSFDNLVFAPIITDILDQRLSFALDQLSAQYEQKISSYLVENISIYVVVMVLSLALLAFLNHFCLLRGEFLLWKMTARTFSVLPRELLMENSLMKIHFEKLIIAYL